MIRKKYLLVIIYILLISGCARDTDLRWIAVDSWSGDLRSVSTSCGQYANNNSSDGLFTFVMIMAGVASATSPHAGLGVLEGTIDSGLHAAPSYDELFKSCMNRNGFIRP